MKKYVTITILLFIIKAGVAQNNAVSLKTKGLFIDNTFRVFTSPQLQIRQKQHSIAAGPSIAIASESTTSDKHYPKLVGLQASYTYYPISNGKFSCFLFDDLLLTRVVDYWSAAIWNDSHHAYESYNYESAEILIANNLGYGIQLNLGKSLFICQSVEAGIYYSVTDNDENSNGAPEINDHNIKGYDPIGFSWGLNLQVGVRL